MEPLDYLFAVELERAVVFWSLRVVSKPAVTAHLRGSALAGLYLFHDALLIGTMRRLRSHHTLALATVLSHEPNTRSSDDLLVSRQASDNFRRLLRDLVSRFA